ncbi:MAG: DUF4296 domain-containing protein [Bacteroidota bacterium]|nr:DUF4296 domain-containing protein [Bacteroidota bacterium]
MGTLLIVSCVHKDVVPSEIIAPLKMQKIMMDMAEAQSYATALARKDSTLSEVAVNKVLTGKVFSLNGTTEAQFQKSYHWYTGHPDILMKMFDSLTVQAQRATLSKMHEQEESRALQKEILKKIEK